ncbi:hypothetical protein Bbelb_154590 [Branchiostoma belcheri]|nr:hypothetical protein Bbelb_154590 [Branchiostoma belcheri]
MTNDGGSAEEVLLSPKCVVCTPEPERRDRDTIPNCTLVQKTNSLWLKNFRLGYLSSSDVSHLKHLNTFYIQPGDVGYLENNTFSGLKLLTLSLTHNKLPYIGKNWLVQVNAHLNLAHNEIAFIESDAFVVKNRWRKTTALHLQWNKLETITQGSFRQLTTLVLLDLRYNKIYTIHRGSFNALYRLRILRLTGNKLTVVRADWFEPVSDCPEPVSARFNFKPITAKGTRLLFNIELARNQIEYIEPQAFKNVPLLGTLDLSNNRLTSLHYATTPTQNETELVFLLKSGLYGTVSIHLLDLVTTALFTLSVVAFIYFVVLRKTALQKSQSNQANCNQPMNEQDADEVSLHHYEAMEDNHPPVIGQDEITPTNQMPTPDDVITPYGQATTSGTYGMGAAMNATVTASSDSGELPCHRQGEVTVEVERDGIHGNDVTLSSNKFEAAKDSNMSAARKNSKTCQAYNLRSNSLTNATHDAEVLDDLSPYCVVCTPVSGHRRRDAIPTCPLVRRTSKLWLRNFRLGSLSLSDLSHLRDVETLYLHPARKDSLEIAKVAMRARSERHERRHLGDCFEPTWHIPSRGESAEVTAFMALLSRSHGTLALSPRRESDVRAPSKAGDLKGCSQRGFSRSRPRSGFEVVLHTSKPMP